MNLKTRSICMVAAALLASTSALQAAPVDVGSLRLLSVQNGDNTLGGEFVWDISGGSGSGAYQLSFSPVGLGAYGVGAGNFISFCVQTTETVNVPATYDADLNDESINGHTPLSAKTAWLYRNFINGTLAGYDYDNSSGERSASGGALQAAIWDFQGQGYAGSALSGTAAALYATFVSAANAASPSGIGNVRILNIWNFGDNNRSGTARQDMLVMIPLPAPAWMAGVGLLGVIGGGVYRRRGGKPMADSI